jgi:hypothetical protein
MANSTETAAYDRSKSLFYFQNQYMDEPKTNLIPHFPVPYTLLERLFREHKPSEVEAILNDFDRHVRDSLGCYYSNSVLQISNLYGDLFAYHLMVRDKARKEWTLMLWGKHQALGKWFLNEEDITNNWQVIREALKATEEFSLGVIPCSECSTKIKTHEVAGRWFAGVYCKECWEGGIKQQEAKQNYD